MKNKLKTNKDTFTENNEKESCAAQNLLPATARDDDKIFAVPDEIFKPMSGYLQSAHADQNNVWSTPMLDVVDKLKRLGIPSDHLKISLITLFSMISASLENPVAVELIDDSESGAEKILEICSDCTPDNYHLCFSGKVTQETLLRQGHNIIGRTIVSFNSDDFLKIKDKLNILLKNQKLETDRTLSDSLKNIYDRVTINGPVSAILITKDQNKMVLDCPSFLSCYVKPSSETIRYIPQPSQQQKALLEMCSKYLSSSFKRLKPQTVLIPYGQELVEKFKEANIPNDKIETLLHFLNIIVIINNSPPINSIEHFSNLYKADTSIIASALGKPLVVSETLNARIVDYHNFWAIMSGAINNGTLLTERSKRVYTAIKNYNMDAYKNLMWNNNNSSKAEILSSFAAQNSPAWATIEDIHKAVNKDGGREIGNRATLYNEIQELLKNGIIGENKYQGQNKKGYYVTTLEIEDIIRLPHPSEIDHEIMRQKIKIMNPITGKVDEI